MIHSCSDKNIPKIIMNWFHNTFPGNQFSFSFYWYGKASNKIYGCIVRKNGILWELPQGTIEDFSCYPSEQSNLLQVHL